MSKKVYYSSLFFIIFLIIAFVYSYIWGLTKYKDENKEMKYSTVDKYYENGYGNQINLGDGVSANTKVVLRTEYKKGGDYEEKTESATNKIIGKNREEIEKIYKSEGYQVDSMNPSEIILVKTIDSYAPNKYVFGIKGGHLAIYRTDKNGNAYIEDESKDVTPIKAEALKKMDLELLLKGAKQFEFDTREQAEAKLEDYI